MASIAQSLPASRSQLEWLWEWLRDELTPYPGRLALVARMVLAATLIMIIGMVFRIPYTWQGAIYALLVSRENPRATVKSAATILLVTGIGAAYIILSMKLVLNISPLHFLWIIVTLFFAFYGISTLTNYLAAVAFVNTTALGIPLWDRHVSAETNLEDMLWLCLATLIAVVVTGAVELAFVRQRQGDEILLPMTERLSAVEDLLNCLRPGPCSRYRKRSENSTARDAGDIQVAANLIALKCSAPVFGCHWRHCGSRWPVGRSGSYSAVTWR